MLLYEFGRENKVLIPISSALLFMLDIVQYKLSLSVREQSPEFPLDCICLLKKNHLACLSLIFEQILLGEQRGHVKTNLLDCDQTSAA